MRRVTPFGKLALPALLVLALLAALPAGAAESGRIQTTHASVWNGPPVLAADSLPADGMRAAIDPRTGALRRPTAAETFVLDALAAPGLSRAWAASEVQLAGGTVMLAVDPELLNYTVFRVDAAGGDSFTCVDGPTHAAELARTAAPAAEVK